MKVQILHKGTEPKASSIVNIIYSGENNTTIGFLHYFLEHVSYNSNSIYIFAKMSEDLAFFNHSRKYVRSQVTKTCNFVEANLSNITSEERLSYINKLKSWSEQLKNFNDKISFLSWK